MREVLPTALDIAQVGLAAFKYRDDIRDVGLEISLDERLITEANISGEEVYVPKKMLLISTGLAGAAIRSLSLSREEQDKCMDSIGVAHGFVFLVDELVENTDGEIKPEFALLSMMRALNVGADIGAPIAFFKDPLNPSQSLFERYAKAMFAEETLKQTHADEPGPNKSLYNDYYRLSVDSNSIPLFLVAAALAFDEEEEIVKNWYLMEKINEVGRLYTDLKGGEVEDDLAADGGNIVIAHCRWSGESHSLEQSRMAMFAKIDELRAEIDQHLESLLHSSPSKTVRFLSAYYTKAVRLMSLLSPKEDKISIGVEQMFREKYCVNDV